jgi:PAS domain S-box-containing protein
MTVEQQQLRSLCEIFSDQSENFERKIDKALEKSLQMLNLDIGIVSKIATTTYTILAYYPEEAQLSKGQVFELGTTYCSLTLEANDVVAIADMGKSKHHGHPCYSTFALESYIGVPLIVDGSRYGTLNFSSLKQAKKDFSASDKELVRLLGQWVASLLERQNKELELYNYHRDLEDIVEDRTSELRAINKNLLEEIEARKRTERTLNEQQFFLKTLLETIPNPVFYKDLIGRYIGCNRSFEEFLGKPRSEIIGKTVYELAPKDIADMYFQKDEELYKKPGKQHYEWKVKKKNGAIREVLFDKATLQGRDGLPTGLIGLITDITERKLMESQLRQAHKLEAIGTLAAGIAHDFNNILSAVIGYSELVQMKIPSHSNIQQDMKNITIAGKRAASLVQQILAFSRQEQQIVERIQIGPIIKEIQKMLKASLPSTIQIDTQIETDKTVLADPIQIHQVLMNLAVNSGYAMREKGGWLRIHLQVVQLQPNENEKFAELKPGEYLKLTVKDTGSGIPKETLDRIFDPFFTTKEKGQGTGMGLSVAHGIINSLKGVIWAESIPGQETIFTILLPLSDSGMLIEPDFEQSAPGGSEKILFVDDEPLLVELGVSLLEFLGYKVTGIDNSEKALREFTRSPQKFDLLITDQTMPGITGSDLAQQILKIRPGMPIILCTGFSNLISQEKARDLGIKGFAMKPLAKADLAALIRKVLDREGSF